MTLIEFHGSGCPKCGGTVGPHSDICLDCGYDESEVFNWWYDRIMLTGFAAFGVLLIAYSILLSLRLG